MAKVGSLHMTKSVPASPRSAKSAGLASETLVRGSSAEADRAKHAYVSSTLQSLNETIRQLSKETNDMLARLS